MFGDLLTIIFGQIQVFLSFFSIANFLKLKVIRSSSEPNYFYHKQSLFSICPKAVLHCHTIIFILLESHFICIARLILISSVHFPFFCNCVWWMEQFVHFLNLFSFDENHMIVQSSVHKQTYILYLCLSKLLTCFINCMQSSSVLGNIVEIIRISEIV